MTRSKSPTTCLFWRKLRCIKYFVFCPSALPVGASDTGCATASADRCLVWRATHPAGSFRLALRSSASNPSRSCNPATGIHPRSSASIYSAPRFIPRHAISMHSLECDGQGSVWQHLQLPGHCTPNRPPPSSSGSRISGSVQSLDTGATLPPDCWQKRPALRLCCWAGA